MKIQLSKGDLNAATQNWNTLVNSKNKNKNYCIPTSIEEYNNFDKFAARLQIDFRDWILLENAVTAFNEVFNRIYEAPELKGIASYETVYTALKKELEVEISNRDKAPNSKREFASVLESIQNSIEDKVSYFDFFFAVEGLALEELDKISYGKVEIFAFNQALCDQMTAAYLGENDSQNPGVLEHIRDFFNKNFLNRLCIKSTAYGDFDTANKKAYRQARELINYFRYILCLFINDRVSEQMIKINLAFEVYGNSEITLIRRNKDNTIILASGRGHKPLQIFSISKNRLEDLSSNGFLDDFSTIINASSQTQLEGCILTAIYWIGEAQNEVDLDVSFLKYWTALECIFTGTEKPTHALAKGVATLNAFSGYEFIRVEDAKEVYKNMTKLYDKRSDIIHRGMNYLANRVINEADISKICKYTAWSILSLFHLRSIGYTSMQEVGDQINRLCSQWNIGIPATQAQQLVQIEPDVLKWFQAQDGEYKTLINSILRQYIESHSQVNTQPYNNSLQAD
ncbi:HEPN domain-containing protein [Nostoc sp. FACHB-190]|uniref:HEPN domain-containing protein n=1 Tax=Nostoc sp. FACHB-190 TaxID=2692838 RepID=UPI001684299E|nr:HEPN domain-containing protein [Nostoc sp. FACHB-190]MBD2303320.1 hypothetical protein [Nostoc sp. FACHB-190]